MISWAMETRIADFILEQAARDGRTLWQPANRFWTTLAGCGSELWLDTGDIEVAESLWCNDFSALTTNNTLLNNEIQKGIYDDLIRQSGRYVLTLGEDEQVTEIGFILNAVHGLRLARRFGARVSVELHTAVARDIGRSEHYGKRFAVLSPDFIVKVPLTPEGLIAANRLQKARVPVNFTLCFSARQNAIAAVFAQPEYVNVFLGRLNAYIENSPAKSCDYLGERATWATQGFLSRTGSPTRLIAASIRSSAQLALLAGVDVLTIPPPVAGDAVEQLDGRWEGYVPDDDAGSSESIVEKTCSISERELEFAEGLRNRPPESGEEVVERAHNSGVGDLFPHLSAEETAAIAADGKIPDHGRWAERLAKGKVALDSLLNLAGLASFSQDQQALDDRIRNVLHEEVKQRA